MHIQFKFTELCSFIATWTAVKYEGISEAQRLTDLIQPRLNTEVGK